MSLQMTSDANTTACSMTKPPKRWPMKMIGRLDARLSEPLASSSSRRSSFAICNNISAGSILGLGRVVGYPNVIILASGYTWGSMWGSFSQLTSLWDVDGDLSLGSPGVGCCPSFSPFSFPFAVSLRLCHVHVSSSASPKPWTATMSTLSRNPDLVCGS